MTEFEKTLRKLIEIKMAEDVPTDSKAQWIADILAACYAPNERSLSQLSRENKQMIEKLAGYAGRLSGDYERAGKAVKDLFKSDNSNKI